MSLNGKHIWELMQKVRKKLTATVPDDTKLDLKDPILIR
jgi:hypothetical protein